MTTKADWWTEDEYESILSFVEGHLWLFVQQYATIHRPRHIVCNLAQLEYSDVKFLQRIYFLLSEVVQKSARTSIPRLLKHVAQSSERRAIETRSRVEGRVDWSSTLRRRLACGANDPTIFVAHRAEKAYDFAQMQAVKYFLNIVAQLCVDVLGLTPADISMGDYEYEPEKWHSMIIDLYRIANTSLKNILLHDVSLPDQINNAMLQRLRTTRNAEFRDVYTALHLYRNLFIHEHQETLRDCFRRGVLRPLSRDRLYETYILFLTLEILDRAGWKKERTQLIGYNEGAIVHYRKGDATLRIYYQSSPEIFQENSLYKTMMAKYKIDAKLRRPDLVLEFNKSCYQLLEVKRSKNRRYIADSLYKVFGYLKDFEALFRSDVRPQAILVVWDDNEVNVAHHDAIIICGRRGYQSFLNSMYLPSRRLSQSNA